MKITESRASDILHWLDDETGNHALLFEKMTLHRDAAALIRQLQAAEQAAWHAGLDAGRETDIKLLPLPKEEWNVRYGYHADTVRDYARACVAAAVKANDAEIEDLRDTLRSVERYANHHGQHPNISAKEALGMIQHHPSIKAITRSYADGRVPATFDPYAEIEALRARAERLAEALRFMRERFARHMDDSDRTAISDLLRD